MTHKIAVINLSNIRNEDYVLKIDGQEIVLPPGGRHDIDGETAPVELRLEPALNEKASARPAKPWVRAYLSE